MEELKIEEEENGKEISFEDILGTQSLLMSESDDETGDNCNDKSNKSPQKKFVSKRCYRLLDSDDDLESKNEIEATNNEEKFIWNKKKISALIDSDSDVDENICKETKLPKKIKTLLKPDVEKIRDDVDRLENKVKNRNNAKKINNIREKSEKSCDLESAKNYVKVQNRLSVVDTDSSESETETEVSVPELQVENSTEKIKKSKVQRESAKKALDEMQAIQSEQQRLHREAHISVPYHKPRKHTLNEFLKRRTIIQPQNASPVAAVIQTRSLKMTSEELEEYAKLMDERAKEATEFFKPESESEEEEVFKDNEGVLDKKAIAVDDNILNSFKQPLDLQNEIEILETTKNEKSTSDEVMENHDGVKLTEADFREILAEEEKHQSNCSKILITEVIELPKLDMNSVKICSVEKHTPRSSLNVKQLLAEKVLSESPSLSFDPNKLIDLETGNLIEKKPSGIENLVERLMTTIKAKTKKTSEICNILSFENGKLEMSKVNVSRSAVKAPQKDAKPGAAYFELKNNLKNIITKKRLEEINKKLDDELEYSKCLADDDSDEDEEILEEPDEETESNVILDDEEENALRVKNYNKTTVFEENAENQKENDDRGNGKDTVADKLDEDTDEDGKDTDELEEDTDEDDKETDDDQQNNNCFKALDKSRKSRIITAFDDSDEELNKDDIDFLKTQPTATQPLLLESRSSVENYLENENKLLALCSGNFDITQKHSALMSQIPITQNCGKDLNDDELMELCSGTFDQPATQQHNGTKNIPDDLMINSNKIVSSDEENDEEVLNVDERNKQKIKKLTKKQKRKRSKLGFSDDEDEEENEYEYDNDYEDVENCNNNDIEAEEESDYDNLKKNAVDEPETFIDYDSEENEILVQLTKNDQVKQAKNFFENEAELSESEWGSADEDENNLDQYDIELGDEDKFDREELQAELGKIHARKMLDEDIREVRKIQELLFEDEEKDGVGRQRTFKWKNAESGFSLEDGRPLNDEGDDNQKGDSGDELNEHQWRKIRFEREQFLKEQGLKPSSQDVSTVQTHSSIPPISVAATGKKFQIITTKKTIISSSDTKNSSPFLISKGTPTMHKKSVRGSFLVRDKETLHKLAGLTKGTSSSNAISNMDDTAGTVSIKSVRPANFVFATLTEEEHENLKRKADDLLNSSNENGKDFMKKPKIGPRRDKCFIDQLL